jgi:hypothetical protein
MGKTGARREPDQYRRPPIIAAAQEHDTNPKTLGP